MVVLLVSTFSGEVIQAQFLFANPSKGNFMLGLHKSMWKHSVIHKMVTCSIFFSNSTKLEEQKIQIPWLIMPETTLVEWFQVMELHRYIPLFISRVNIMFRTKQSQNYVLHARLDIRNLGREKIVMELNHRTHIIVSDNFCLQSQYITTTNK
jgi:hypothetical protein